MALAGMTLEHVLERGGDALITNAVHEAEKRTSGEIVVRLTQAIDPPNSAPREAALAQFEQLGLANTRERNAVLIYVALDEHAIELVADEGIASAMPGESWQSLVEIVSLGFRCDFPAEGLVMAVTKVGDLLAGKFPRKPGDVNEFPDSVISDEERGGER